MTTPSSSTGSTAGPPYFFCLDHHTVETRGGCPADRRLGPYPTEAAAAAALETVAERNEAWDNDPRWNDDAER